MATVGSFYRNFYQTVIVTLITAIFFMLFMVVVVLYQISHRPLPEFRAIAANGKSISLSSFDEPNLLPDTLIRWASKAAVAAYTFDFVNYNKQIQLARPYFTELGWIQYQAGVTQLIQQIVQKQIFVNGVVSGPPVISNQGDLSGKGYAWRVQLPFLVTYQSSESTNRQNFMVLMTIIRIPTFINPVAIGIDQFLMRG